MKETRAARLARFAEESSHDEHDEHVRQCTLERERREALRDRLEAAVRNGTASKMTRTTQEIGHSVAEYVIANPGTGDMGDAVDWVCKMAFESPTETERSEILSFALIALSDP